MASGTNGVAARELDVAMKWAPRGRGIEEWTGQASTGKSGISRPSASRKRERRGS